MELNIEFLAKKAKEDHKNAGDNFKKYKELKAKNIACGDFLVIAHTCFENARNAFGVLKTISSDSEYSSYYRASNALFRDTFKLIHDKDYV